MNHRKRHPPRRRAGPPPRAGCGSPPAHGGEEPLQPPPSAPTARVLVVDDELHLRRVFGNVLTREGHRVILAARGEEALERIAEELPDFLILDGMLGRGGLDGFDVLARLKKDPRTRALPVLMLTARSADGPDAGGDKDRGYHVSKPFEVGAFGRLVTLILRGREDSPQFARTLAELYSRGRH